MSMTIPAAAIGPGVGRAGEVIERDVEVTAERIAPRPSWSLRATFDDRGFAESLGCRPILTPLAA